MCEGQLIYNRAQRRSGRNLQMIVNATVQGDPTHTLTLRRRFAAEASKRFKALKQVIRQSIVDNDCFGMREEGSSPVNQVAPSNIQGPGLDEIQGKYNPIPAKRFAFTRSGDKVQGFMNWMEEQQKNGILEVTEAPQSGQAIEKQWQNKYLRGAYQKGIARGRQELNKAGYPVQGIDEAGGMDAVFNQPFHADRVGAIYTRAFNELKGITDAMDQQISRTLAEGLAEGMGPEQMARNINDRVEKVGITRARTLARTETVRAHHVATIQEYENAGAEGVKVKAEWSTAGDLEVCPICAPLEGARFDLKTIRGMIPRHPNCRCVALPIDRGDVEGTGTGTGTTGEGGGPSFPTLPDQVADNVRAGEKKIAKADVEHGKIYDSDTGEELGNFTESGGFEVEIPNSQVGNVRGNIFTHNHPSGDSFSDTDMIVANNLGMKEMRAVGVKQGKRVTHRLRPPGRTIDARKFEEEFWEKHREKMREFRRRRKAGEISEEYSDFHEYDAVVREMAEKYGFRYERIVEDIKESPWEKVREKVNADPVASQFAKLKEGNDFLKKKDEYRKFFDQYSDEDLSRFRNNLTTTGRPDIEEQDHFLKLQQEFKDKLTERGSRFKRRSIGDWQGSTMNGDPMLMKRAASEMESNIGKMAYPRDWDQLKIDGIKKAELPREDYLDLRAFNQAYMERLGIEYEDLYRGLDGRTGAKIARDIAKEGMHRTKWPIEESPLTGFSSSKEIADKFGAARGAMTYTRKVPRSEIVVHRDLLSGITSSFTREQEFIIIGGKRKINLSEIDISDKYDFR